MTERYDMRKEPDGSWSIFNVLTGQPVMFDGALMVGFDVLQAQDMLDLLNNRGNKEGTARRTPPGSD